MRRLWRCESNLVTPMLGFSDTTVGAIVSVMLHAGVAVAFLGPLGDGEGAGSNVVMVSIDGVAVRESPGEELPQGESHPIAPPVTPESLRALQRAPHNPKQAKAATTPKRLQRASQPAPSKPVAPQSGEVGGGGLLGALYSQPVMISMPKPLYPRSARERGSEGRVSVKVWVRADGTVERAEVVKSSGSEPLDRAAHESTLEAQFKPALQAGVPTAAHKIMVVTFSLVE